MENIAVQPEQDFLYEQVADDIATMIEAGSFRFGDRIPSVRELSRKRGVSITTVMQAYRSLEDKGLIEARPQSGYYVRLRKPPGLPAPDPVPGSTLNPAEISVEKLAIQIFRENLIPGMVHFGAATPDPDLLPTSRLNRILATLSRKPDYRHSLCGIIDGCEELRVQVAQRSFQYGCRLAPEDILITSGCIEAVSLGLRATCKPGDTVAIESPTYFNLLQMLEAQGLRALEIPTHPETGVSLDALRFAIEHQSVRACLFVTNFNNPLGSLIPDERKEEMVAFLAAHDVPLIEDDINGELYFSGERSNVAKAYDKKGLVLLCSSYSKDISPSYRVGWIAPGRYKDEIERLKLVSNIAPSLLPQLAIAEFLAGGGYDHHLRRIRKAYAQKTACMADSILRHFPPGTCVSSPQGGFVLWVQMAESVDALEMYSRALKLGITLVPGHVFSTSNQYRNYIRLNTAQWSDKTAWAVQRLGVLAAQLENKRQV
ncbi:MAG: PLP-dependent aminotransferase family protein [Anaerolineales bacterium]|nr:PLP-dependent aminotransferase family protein [Anaerolineales bacterium]